MRVTQICIAIFTAATVAECGGIVSSVVGAVTGRDVSSRSEKEIRGTSNLIRDDTLIEARGAPPAKAPPAKGPQLNVAAAVSNAPTDAIADAIAFCQKNPAPGQKFTIAFTDNTKKAMKFSGGNEACLNKAKAFVGPAHKAVNGGLVTIVGKDVMVTEMTDAEEKKLEELDKTI